MAQAQGLWRYFQKFEARQRSLPVRAVWAAICACADAGAAPAAQVVVEPSPRSAAWKGSSTQWCGSTRRAHGSLRRAHNPPHAYHPVPARHRPVQVHHDAGGAPPAPGAQVQYRFKCRTPASTWQATSPRSMRKSTTCAACVSATRNWTTCGLRFVKPDFADFLGLFHLDRKYIQLRASTAVPGEIELDITGPWLHTILFEVPLLAIINEVWFRNTTTADFAEGERRLQARPRCCAIPPVSSTAASPTTAAAAATRVTGMPACCRCCATRSARSWSVPATSTSRACRHDPARHHGPRVPAGVPGARPAPA